MKNIKKTGVLKWKIKEIHILRNFQN
jgi:hypothetical protein